MFERIILTGINDHVYLMDDNHEATGYLVVGSQKALVIDTMNGIEDVKAVVRSITDLPIMVVNTHGHCDHIYGNVFFDNAYMNPKDLDVARKHMNMPEFVERCQKMGYKMPDFTPIRGGDEIDLGGLHLSVIDLPGHTPGGILLLLKEDRILFTGDGINHFLWMQLEDSLPMEEFAENLKKVMYLEQEADYILNGHTWCLDDIGLMSKLLKGAEEIVRGETKDDKPYEWFGGVDKMHQFDEGINFICY